MRQVCFFNDDGFSRKTWEGELQKAVKDGRAYEYVEQVVAKDLSNPEMAIFTTVLAGEQVESVQAILRRYKQLKEGMFVMGRSRATFVQVFRMALFIETKLPANVSETVRFAKKETHLARTFLVGPDRTIYILSKGKDGHQWDRGKYDLFRKCFTVPQNTDLGLFYTINGVNMYPKGDKSSVIKILMGQLFQGRRGLAQLLVGHSYERDYASQKPSARHNSVWEYYPIALDLNDKRNYTLAQEIAIIEDLLEGLMYMHREGIIHGDIKDSNVRMRQVGDRFEAVLADFGLSFSIDNPRRLRGRHGSLIGTAPELFANYNFTGDCYKLDIFGLGVAIFEWLHRRAVPWTSSYDVLCCNFPKVPENANVSYEKMVEECLKQEYTSLDQNERRDQLLSAIMKMMSADPNFRSSLEQVQAEITTIKQAPHF